MCRRPLIFHRFSAGRCKYPVRQLASARSTSYFVDDGRTKNADQSPGTFRGSTRGREYHGCVAGGAPTVSTICPSSFWDSTVSPRQTSSLLHREGPLLGNLRTRLSSDCRVFHQPPASTPRITSSLYMLHGLRILLFRGPGYLS